MTNNHNLPEWLLKAIDFSNAQYSAGDSDYTATSLITPPQIAVLEKEHKHEIEEDYASQIPSFIGTGVHFFLEHLFGDDPNYITEERYFHTLEGKKISAQVDLFCRESSTLVDFKLTSVFKLNKEEQDEYDFQLNMGRYLMHHNGIQVDNLAIGGFPLDWRNGESKRYKDYPSCKFKELEIPVWSLEKTEEEIILRIREREEAKKGNVRECTDKERWVKNDDKPFAVMKKGRKSAIRLFEFAPSQDQVKELGGEWVEERPTTYRRCEEWCTVSQWCPQYNGT